MNHAYRSTPEDLPLDADTVHVWRVVIWPSPGDAASLTNTLSDDELRRAAKFHFEIDRLKYQRARSALRRLLGRYLDIAPQALEFEYGAHRKPALPEAIAGGLEFNVAHSGDLALVAVTRGARVGVDLELLRDVPEALAIARSHFTPAEARLLASVDVDPRAAFFRLWTRKEAIIKALGTGLSTPLAEFDVSSTAPADGAWREVEVTGTQSSRWQVCDLPAAEGYHAALAIDGAPRRVELWRE